MYTPWFFDRSGQWLFARINAHEAFDGPYIPSSFGLVRINLLTWQVVPLLRTAEYFEMDLSPDRTRVVYTMEYTLGILDLANGELQLISLPYVYASFLEWSPDGTQFLLVAQKDFSDTPQQTMEVVIVSPGSDQPLKDVYTISQGMVIEWNAAYGIVVQTYDRILEYGQWAYSYEWWGIDPANPTPVAIPSLTPVQR